MNEKDKKSKYLNLVFSFSVYRNIKLLISIFLVEFILISLHSIEIIKIENPSSEFIERYEQDKRERPEDYLWNPLQVGNHWQYTAYTGSIVNTIIVSDSTFNDTIYYKKQYQTGYFTLERNTETATYCRDIFDFDNDPLTTELLWDSLDAEAPYAYYSYHNPDLNASIWETIIMEKYIAYLPLFEDSAMVANLVRYGGTVGIEEYWAEGYGLILSFFGGGHSTLTAAYIDGNQYGNFVGVEEITIPHSSSLITNLINYPNPFNPTTTISFELPVNIANPVVEIFNIKGEKVKVLDCSNHVIAKARDSLSHTVTWNGTDNYRKPVSSGVYLYRIKADECEIGFSKMILLK
jgi:hypothetical protein